MEGRGEIRLEPAVAGEGVNGRPVETIGLALPAEMAVQLDGDRVFGPGEGHVMKVPPVDGGVYFLNAMIFQ
jgi:hypothetical protein